MVLRLKSESWYYEDIGTARADVEAARSYRDSDFWAFSVIVLSRRGPCESYELEGCEV